MERITKKKRCRGGDFRFLRGVIQSDHISNLVEVRFRVFVAKRQGADSWSKQDARWVDQR